jgi:hypothetical protein
MGRSPYHERDSNPLQNQNPLVMMGKLLEMKTAHQSLSLTPSLPDASPFFQLKGLILPSLTTFVCRQFFGNFSHSNPLFFRQSTDSERIFTLGGNIFSLFLRITGGFFHTSRLLPYCYEKPGRREYLESETHFIDTILNYGALPVSREGLEPPSEPKPFGHDG